MLLNTQFMLFSGELWTERIMLYYVEDNPGAWSEPSNIRSVVIDAECGTPFEGNAYDLNADGKSSRQLKKDKQS